jgi:S1-C subfamily serine protease
MNPERRLAALLVGLLATTSLAAAPPRPARQPAAEAENDGVASAVVRIFAYATPLDPQSPWRRTDTEAASGTGVVIDGNRILTAAHVVADAVSVQVKLSGRPDRFPAEVVQIAHDADLALVRPLDPAFFDGVTPLRLGRLPEVNRVVQAYGFPVGGDTLSVTSGILSRIEVSTYDYSTRDLLMAQIDASINPGNSGGPVVSGGALVGIALQTLEKAESVGYMAPAPVIEHVLRDLEDGHYDGFPMLGIAYQDLESPALRASLGMKAVESGVRISQVDHGGPADGVLAPGDVLAAIDGVPIANDGTVTLEGLGRVRLDALYEQKEIGEQIRITVEKDGARQERTLTLARHRPLVPGRDGGQAEYLIFGGVVFQPLTMDYLRSVEDPPSDLTAYALYRNVVTERRSEVILIERVLPHPVNQGFEDWEGYVVETINGEAPRDMRELARIIDGATGPWLRIVTEDQSVLTLSLPDARAAQRQILASFGIGRDRSAGLAAGSSAPTARP